MQLHAVACMCILFIATFTLYLILNYTCSYVYIVESVVSHKPYSYGKPLAIILYVYVRPVLSVYMTFIARSGLIGKMTLHKLFQQAKMTADLTDKQEFQEVHFTL